MNDEFNNSDHHYIRFSLDAARPRTPSTRSAMLNGWDTSGGIVMETIQVGLFLAEWTAKMRPPGNQNVDSEISEMVTRISAACDYALPRRRDPKPGKPPLHWWNGEIAALRQACIRAKRAMSRMSTRIASLRRRADETAVELDPGHQTTT